MRDILVSNDIIPVGQFKSDLAKYLKDIHENRNSLIITQNGKPTGVLISPAEFDELQHTKIFINSISKGLAESNDGEVLSISKVKNELKRDRNKRIK